MKYIRMFKLRAVENEQEQTRMIKVKYISTREYIIIIMIALVLFPAIKHQINVLLYYKECYRVYYTGSIEKI